MADSTATLGHDPAYARGIGLVLLAGAFMSIGGIVIRLMEGATPWQIVGYRAIALGATLLVTLAVRNRESLVTAFRKAGRTGVVAGTCIAAANTCFIFSITHTTVANSLFLLSAAPFLAALLGRLLIGEAVRRATWLAMGVALVGVSVMVGEGIAVGGLFGNLAGLGAALGFAGFTVALRSGKAVDMLPAVCIGAAVATLVAGAMALAGGDGLRITAYDLGLCALLGVAQVSFGLIVFTLGSRHVPAAELALLSLTEVVLGPIWVWLAIGEVPSELTIIGGAILMTAIAGQALGGLRRRRPPIGVV
jgi:drug/metabolite transporter (DMT)-like permease